MSKFTIQSLVAATLLGIFGSSALAAQGFVRTQQPRAYLGFSYESVFTGPRDGRSIAIVVVEVVENSPAERAGLAVDDTVLSINDIRVSDEFVQSLSTSLEPGDRVRLRVRRDGRDRDITVEAARRPAGYGMATPSTGAWTWDVSPDSLRGRVRFYLDSALVALDTMRFPNFRVESTPGGGVWMFTDSARLQIMPDSAWTGARTLIFPRDSMHAWSDSAIVGSLPRIYSFGGDSLIRMYTDSALYGARPFAFSIESDSLRGTLRYGLRGGKGGRIFGLRGDTVWTYSSPSSGFGIASFGMRAIGGAELTELSEDLGEYFGADEGLLVLRVPDSTPAARAGLEEGDVIVSANGRDVSSVAELRRAIGRSDEPIRLEIIRRNQRRTIEMNQ